MKHIKKYIRGNSERGKEVIAELEKLGGENTFYLRGDDENELYFIDIQNAIDSAYLESLTGQLILTHPEWEEIKLPDQFKDGDVVISRWGSIHLLRTADSSYCAYREDWKGLPKFDPTRTTQVKAVRLANKEEEEKLFKAIKENGYKWNPVTKALEKLIEPKFKVGDVIQSTHKYKVKITEVNLEDKVYGYESLIAKGIGGIAFFEQDYWELVPNKFDISTLVPFESRVLVRDYESEIWVPAIWGWYDEIEYYRYGIVGGVLYNYCIPYEGNEHLLGTTNDCPDFYKTWEE